MDSRLVDAFGLALPNTYLCVNIPSSGNAFVFRVIESRNQGYPLIDYGTLPLTSGATLATYAGGNTTFPANGVFPAQAFTNNGNQFAANNPPTSSTSIFPNSSGTIFDTSDIFHISGQQNPNTLFDVIQEITPRWLRVAVNIPTNQTQQAFQVGQIAGGVGSSFGFKRGIFNAIHIPGLIYGYNWGNDTNIATYTNVKLRYGEYVVQIPKDPALIFDILSHQSRIPVNWKTMPMSQYPQTFSQALLTAYGFEGFPLYGVEGIPPNSVNFGKFGSGPSGAIAQYTALLGQAII